MGTETLQGLPSLGGWCELCLAYVDRFRMHTCADGKLRTGPQPAPWGKEGKMPFDSERPAKPRTSEEDGVSIGIAFGQALIAHLTGPCAMGEHCPIKAGEVWQPGKCMMDECPRQKPYGSAD